MADLNIPKLNMNSEKYIFKKNLSLRRKSIKRLFFESVFMFILSLFLVYLNYLIPNKILLLQKVPTNLYKSFVIFMDLFSSLYEIFLVIFIFISSIITFILLTGSFYRIFRIANRKQSFKKGYK